MKPCQDGETCEVIRLQLFLRSYAKALGQVAAEAKQLPVPSDPGCRNLCRAFLPAFAVEEAQVLPELQFIVRKTPNGQKSPRHPPVW